MTISIPLNINISLINGFGVIVGGEPSFVVYEIRKDELVGEWNQSGSRAVSNHKQFDLGFNVGLCKSWEKLNLEIRYTQGLHDIYRNGIKHFTFEGESDAYKNSNLQFTLGYKLFFTTPKEE